MSTWPSRGLGLFGIEIKVSRGDWLRENKNPEKADEVAAYCDHWVVAVGDESIVKDGELPAQWGLLVPGKHPGTLRMKQPPGKLEAKPMSRSFLARILRKTLEVAVPLSEVDSEIERRVTERMTELEKTLTRTLTRDFDPAGLKESNEKLLASVKVFKDATGVWIDAYDPQEFKRLAKVLNLMRWSDLNSWLDRFEKMADDHKSHIKILRNALPPEHARQIGEEDDAA